MIPGLIILILFMAYPFFLGIYLSLTDKRVGFASFDIVGLDNFRRLLNDPSFGARSPTPSSTASSPSRSNCCSVSVWRWC